MSFASNHWSVGPFSTRCHFSCWLMWSICSSDAKKCQRNSVFSWRKRKTSKENKRGEACKDQRDTWCRWRRFPPRDTTLALTILHWYWSSWYCADSTDDTDNAALVLMILMLTVLIILHWYWSSWYWCWQYWWYWHYWHTGCRWKGSWRRFPPWDTTTQCLSDSPDLCQLDSHPKNFSLSEEQIYWKRTKLTIRSRCDPKYIFHVLAGHWK